MLKYYNPGNEGWLRQKREVNIFEQKLMRNFFFGVQETFEKKKDWGEKIGGQKKLGASRTTSGWMRNDRGQFNLRQKSGQSGFKTYVTI